MQLRPDIEFNDTIHSLGNKTIKLVGEKICSILSALENKLIEPKAQSETGKIFYNRDFNDEILLNIYKNFSSRMIERFLENKSQRILRKPIVFYDFI
jgi:methionyl-tRNA formyltransferase